ncbi:helix-turn-helix domain-containing protein [Actinomadura macra]|uniref:helix-turn-helix domain-containing protein n=1 Tax=Actinomadura macra TaxID=46164 RepID=UPI00082C01FD|nr:helix-turn-helix transcriptional regulator [Actinomadura macra]
METFGEKLCELMAERQISQRKLSNLVPCDDGYVSRLVRGLRMPSEEMAARFDEILGADGSLAALRPDPPKPKRSGAAAAGTVMLGINPDLWDDDMERRALLQLAALGMSAGALGTEPLGRLVDLALTIAPRDLDDWHLTCDDHLHAIRTQPPEDARRELVIDLLALDRQLKAADVGERTELQRVQASLATLYANVLTRLGDHGPAIRWWRTARAAADATGDLELRLGVRATETGHARYGQRSPALVLHLVQNYQHIAGAKGSLGSALLKCSEAKAFSALGRHEEANNALRTCEDLFPAVSNRCDIMQDYWTGGQLQFASLVISAGAGDEGPVQAALANSLAVLSRTGDHPYVTQNQLQAALCTVVNGGIDRGARQAAEILAALPPSRWSHMITETGKAVVRAVPVERRDRAAVRELCALTSSPHL